MTVKLAIIGTSHVSSIFLAWAQIKARFPDLKPTFFAAPGKNFRRLQIDTHKKFGVIDRSLFAPREIRMLEKTFASPKIDLSAFDAVVHVGHNTLKTELAELITSFSIEGLRESPDHPMLSRPAYDSFVAALAEKSVLPENWRGWNAPRLYVLPAPRVAESCAKSQSADYAAWRQLMKEADTTPVAKLLNDYSDQVTAHFAAHGIKVLTPPARVFAASGLSRATYTKNALRLTDGHSYPNGDHNHMNVDYGLIVLRHVCQTLQKDFGITAKPKATTA